jgi:hypothetical protein
VEKWTSDHLDTAERNRDLARSLLVASSSLRLPVPPYEWAAVIAFYAAVHYVNAYLWERYRIAPRDHADRNHHVRTDPILRRCLQAYNRLRDEGYRSRYHRSHRLNARQAAGLVNVDLVNVESVVRAAT